MLDIIACIILITLISLQEGGSGGLGSLAGNFETFLDRSGGGTMEEKLKKFTSVAAIAFAILSAVLYVLSNRL